MRIKAEAGGAPRPCGKSESRRSCAAVSSVTARASGGGSLRVWQPREVVRSERFPDLGDEVLFPRLSDAKLAWLAKRGERRTFQPGEVLYEHAVRDAPFYVIERGLVEFVDRKPGKDVYIAQADGRTFIGDIAVFTGEPTISACVAVEPTDVIMFDRYGLRDMVARWPEFGEHVFATLLARRAWHEAEGHGVMRLIAPRGSRRAFEVRDLLERNLLPVRWYDVDTDAESAALLDWLDIPRSETPVLVHATEVMRNPSAAQVARSLGLRAEVDGQRFDLVVLGAGTGRAGGRRVRRLGRAADVRGRGLGAGRPGWHEHADRELPRLPERGLRDGADAQGDAAGASLRRGAVELPSRGRAGRRARGSAAGRSRRRPACARSVRS